MLHGTHFDKLKEFEFNFYNYWTSRLLQFCDYKSGEKYLSAYYNVGLQ